MNEPGAGDAAWIQIAVWKNSVRAVIDTELGTMPAPSVHLTNMSGVATQPVYRCEISDLDDLIDVVAEIKPFAQEVTRRQVCRRDGIE